MKKILIIISILSMFAYQGQAQNYNTAIGLRLGYGYGFTIKHAMGKGALEGLLHTRYYGRGHGVGGFNITVLYEFHGDFPGAPQLQWFIGLGGHIGVWQGHHGHKWFEEDRSYFIVGADVIAGIEYTFTEVPINLGLDWKPAFNFIGHTGIWADELAFSIRYAF